MIQLYLEMTIIVITCILEDYGVDNYKDGDLVILIQITQKALLLLFQNNDEPALLPFVAKMNDTLLEFSEEPKDVQILDEYGNFS